MTSYNSTQVMPCLLFCVVYSDNLTVLNCFVSTEFQTVCSQLRINLFVVSFALSIPCNY